MLVLSAFFALQFPGRVSGAHYGIPFPDTLEDHFQKWVPENWYADRSFRHCGGMGEECMYATEHNIYLRRHEESPFLESSELKISMQNDCTEQHCCISDRHCSDYTSGQITSKHAYGYGTYTFSLQVEQESGDHLWTCFNEFDYIGDEDSETINQADFPLSLEADEVIQKCKDICVNDYKNCVAFWFQTQPTIHVCNWKSRQLGGSWSKSHPRPGIVCTLKRFIKNLKRRISSTSRPRSEESEDEDNGAGPSATLEVAETSSLSQNSTTLDPQQVDVESDTSNETPLNGDDTGTPPPLEEHPDLAPITNDAGAENEQDEEVTTFEVFTTGEEYGNTTTPVPVPVVIRQQAKLCVALVGIAAAGSHAWSKIRLCIPSFNTRKASIESRTGSESYSQLVDLPFDASQQTGLFSVTWLPGSIIWKANDEKIAEIGSDMPIPKKPLHIRIFVAPLKPIVTAPAKLVKHSMRLFKAGFQKLKKKDSDKTELFVLGDGNVGKGLVWVLAGGMICLILMLSFGFWNVEKAPEALGKPLLQDDLQGEFELFNDMEADSTLIVE